MVYSCESWLKIIFVLAVVYLLGLVTPIYLPIIVAVILSFILNPLVNYLCLIRIWPKIGYLPRGVAVLLAFFLTGIILIGIIIFIFLPFINEFEKFVVNFPLLLLKIQNITKAIEERVNTVAIPVQIQNITDQALSSAAAFSVDLARRMLNATFGFASKIIELVVVPVLTYYFLKDWRRLKEGVIAFFSGETKIKVSTLIDEMAQVVSAYIRGQALVSIVIGLLVFSGMYLLGVDYPLVLGLLATLTETIPIIGPIVGSVPAIMLAYFSSPALALKVMAFYLVVHQLENHIIVPNIMGRTIDLHPIVVIISLLIGAQLMGIMGMILAVPVAALLRVLIKYFFLQT
ncbi:MAG TPA: AI-2E family transporter [Negativicutes bacterium]